MSCLISLNNIHFKYNLDPVLENIDFSINSNEKIAIVGHNGSGKSTLLHILSGKITSFEGTRSVKKGLRTEIVEQYLDRELEKFSLIDALLEKIPLNERSFKRYEAEILLGELFFRESEFDTLVLNLSGGGQNRLMFARAIINQPDLVFMDEPTNHLDLKSLLFIEDYIVNKAKFSVVVVSHDKTFLGNISNKTIILRDKMSYSFNLSYEKALVELEKADVLAKKRLELEEKEINRIRKSAKRLAEWGRTFDNEDLSKKAKSMEKRAIKLEDNKTFVTEGNPYELNLDFNKSNSKIALQYHKTKIHYGDKIEHNEANVLFDIDQFYIKTGEKVALLGANGAGKSTLIDSIIRNLKEEKSDDSFRYSPTLDFGLYDQEQLVLDPMKSIHSEVCRLTGFDDVTVKNTLIRTGFNFDRHSVLVNTLSGGEKSRIIFCVLYLKKPNFLILDEPTNHIDLDGKNELVNSLNSSEITALITGHDRFFIDEVADRYVLIKESKLIEIDDPSEFYEDLFKERDTFSSVGSKKRSQEAVTDNDDQGLLEQILELESKLEDDLKRKLKFQKPKLQEEWKVKITQLYKELD